jgi:hypothetical protein
MQYNTINSVLIKKKRADFSEMGRKVDGPPKIKKVAKPKVGNVDIPDDVQECIDEVLPYGISSHTVI